VPLPVVNGRRAIERWLAHGYDAWMRSVPLLTFLLACTGGVDKSDTGAADTADTDSGAPDIVLDPDTLDFGSLEVGFSVVATVTIGNVGTGDLQISSIALADIDLASIYTLSSISFAVVPPGDEVTLMITFAPADAVPYTSEVLVGSNDPDEPEAAVAVSGTGVAP
jgi:hypothetical protein